MAYRIYTLMFVALFTLAAACGRDSATMPTAPDPPSPPPVPPPVATSITVTPATLTLTAIGQTAQLTARVFERSISFQTNKMTGNVPPELGQLSELTTLVLSTNRLTGDIPLEFTQLSSLTRLGLSSNRLTGDIPRNWDSSPSSYGYGLEEISDLRDHCRIRLPGLRQCVI